jgi:hypothetical protein
LIQVSDYRLLRASGLYFGLILKSLFSW